MPRASQTQPIGLRPACNCKGGAKLLQRSYKHEIDGITGQAVAGNREARQAIALGDFSADANDAWQDDICSYSVCEGQGQNRRQPVVGPSEDINDQPDAQ